MRRACRGTAEPTSGHHPEAHPDFPLDTDRQREGWISIRRDAGVRVSSEWLPLPPNPSAPHQDEPLGPWTMALERLQGTPDLEHLPPELLRYRRHDCLLSCRQELSDDLDAPCGRGVAHSPSVRRHGRGHRFLRSCEQIAHRSCPSSPCGSPLRCGQLPVARCRAHRGITLSRTLVFPCPTTPIYPALGGACLRLPRSS